MPTISVDKYKLYEALGQKCVPDLPLPMAIYMQPRDGFLCRAQGSS